MELSVENESHKPIIARVNDELGPKLVKKVKSIQVSGLQSVKRDYLVQVVFNPNRYRLFLGQLETVEKRSTEPVFQRTFRFS